ncbi:MAG: C10 family peptidase [Bacteroidaceae bacterium]|nr:C10 family peptidase [Bacteroidaceae bacterium]
MKRLLSIALLFIALSLQAQRHEVRQGGRVLAYGLRFNPNVVDANMPEALQEMLRAYQTQPRYAERQRGKAVEPLLKSIRHQDDPFNRSCPYYTDDEGRTSSERCIVGCVATCIEQVLSYYRHPEALIDTLWGWETEHYRIDNVMPATRIDWPNILDDYSRGYTDVQAKAVADLSYYCGMAARMNWGLTSSGANLYRAFEPLWRVFDYQTLAFVPRAMYSTPAWNRMLRNELESGRPICYTGHNMALSGHAFNIDGVDEDGYYHLNWGYGGQYDGYFDLDYLNPFETYDDASALGLHEGFFSNQTALFLHPDDFLIDITDTLSPADAFAGVLVDKVTFRRPPDTQGYVVADFTMENQTCDSLNFTFEVLTYLPTDTAIFYQADYVGLSAVNLAPGERKTWPVYCQFAEAGERIFSFSADDVTLPYQMDVTILEGTTPKLVFGNVGHQVYRTSDQLFADFSLDVSNLADSGYAGNLVTFCLFPEGSDEDQRHWEVLCLPAGETYRLTTRFQHLQDGKTYTLRVRCPWAVQQEYTFTVLSDEAADGIHCVNGDRDDNLYDLQGRRVVKPYKGLYIHRGRKILIP